LRGGMWMYIYLYIYITCIYIVYICKLLNPRFSVRGIWNFEVWIFQFSNHFQTGDRPFGPSWCPARRSNYIYL
jgi:hypothetical protein